MKRTIAIAASAFCLISSAAVTSANAQAVPRKSPAVKIGPETGAMSTRQRCSNCHALEKGATSFAPPLFGLIGRKAGSWEGFQYTAKIKALDMDWTEQALDDWLAGTTFKTPDIRQRHVGIEQPELRRAVVEYIGTLK